MTNTRRYLIVVGAAVAAIAVWAAVRSTHRVDGTLRHGPPTAPTTEKVTLRFFRNPVALPAFTAHDLDGRVVSSADWRGKVTLVNFWATWCGPCKAEIPELIALQEKYRDHLQIIGVSEDEQSPEFVHRFATEYKINYPVVMATPDLKRHFPGVSALPTSFFLDREVRVVQKHVGMLTRLRTELEIRALAGLPVNASIEEVDRVQPARLENAAEVTTIPGVDLGSLTADRRSAALQKLNAEPCTCGCDFTVAKCRIDDPNCSVSLPLARQIVKQVAEAG